MQRASVTAIDTAIDSKPCEICGKEEDADDDDGLLCDRCDRAYHPKCLDEGKRKESELPYWFCSDCIERVKEANERDVIYDFNLHRFLMKKSIEGAS